MADNSFVGLILAAQRTGVVDPLAVQAGVSHKCLVPICGKPLLAHVLDTLLPTPGLRLVRISVEAEAVEALRPLIDSYADRGVPIEFTPSAPSIADSVIAATRGATGPFVITTADNVLMTPEAVAAMRAAMANGADAAAALATKGAVRAAHPEGQRRFYELKDDGYSNCNLYAVAGPEALAAAEIFREGGQFVKNPKRMINAFGLINILLVRYRLVSLKGAMKRLSKRFRLRLEAVVLADGSNAIDVDNERTYKVAAELLGKRLARG